MIGKLRYSLAFKILAGVVLLLALLSLFIGMIGYRGFTEAILEQYVEGAFRTADSAAELVNPDHIERFVESGGKTGEYEAVHFSMNRLCNSQGVTFIYVIQPDRTDYGHIKFIFSTINDESPYTQYEFGFVRATTNDEYREKYRQMYEEGLERALVVRDSGYIQTDKHITAMIPLKGADRKTKAILCVQRQLDVLDAARIRYVRNVVLALAAVSALVILGQGAFIYQRMLAPVLQITKEADRFADESIPAEKKLAEQIPFRDEIGDLADAVDRMEEQVCTYMDNLTRITAEKEHMAAELNVARKIQSGMLPNLFPPFPEKKSIDLFASMNPAREVGGDFYDFFLVDEDHLAMVIADVSGKGIPAALFMMVSDILIRTEVKHGTHPAEALTRVNDRLCSSNRAEMFVTTWLGILELSSGRLQAANAGHEYPAIMRAGGEYELYRDPHGLVLGGLEGIVYRDYEVQLKKGDCIFVYTDGVTEAADKDNRQFGTDRMLQALNKEKDKNADKVLSRVLADIRKFVGKAPQFDDITMMCLKYKGPEDEDKGGQVRPDAEI